jgi:hypothetical protein
MISKAIGLIYAAYPQAKLTEDFLNVVRMGMAHFTDSEIEALADPHTGVATKCPFPPGLAEITDFVLAYRKKEQEIAHQLEAYDRRQSMTKLPLGAYRRLEREPWPGGKLRYLSDLDLRIKDCPRLAAAFRDDPEVMAILADAQAPLLRDAVRAHAERGKAAAREVITGQKATTTEAPVILPPTKRPEGPFRPYPKLWEAFADEPEMIIILDNRHPDHLQSFESLTQYSKTLAVRGKEAAREEILRPRKMTGWIPPPPKVDISDFPDAEPRR